MLPVALIGFSAALLGLAALVVAGLRQGRPVRLLWALPMMLSDGLFLALLFTHGRAADIPLWATGTGFGLLLVGMSLFLLVPRRLR